MTIADIRVWDELAVSLGGSTGRRPKVRLSPLPGSEPVSIEKLIDYVSGDVREMASLKYRLS
jgi:hypothetical protein